MRVVQSWLKSYTSFRLSPEELGEKLTMLGLEFESIERPGDRYNGFVVGRVLEVNKHPRADRLTVCRVDVGKEILQIVCGAPNVAVGQKVAVGLVGAIVPRNQHDPAGAPMTLGRVSLRGVESFGMICSEYELDLGKDAEGIVVLDDHARVGQSLGSYLGLDDVVYDVEITPNRPDWLSHIGIAREIGVLTGIPPKVPRVTLKEGSIPLKRHLSVKVVDKENCWRFSARMIRGVRVGPSPRWLQDWLRNAGLRPRNNIVDITNFVMLECGHPMHAFDYAMLQGGKLVIRQAEQGLLFTTLDEKKHSLPDGVVMICDAEREVSIAGVMGGANSEINDNTVDVVLESACWNPSSIRRTAKALGISSDASQRFERGADPNAVPYALNRAAQLVLQLAGGTLLKGVIDISSKPVRERRVALRPERANALLGTSIATREMERHLRILGIQRVGRKKDALVFRVPTFRVDIEREIDLIEEVARVHGYNNIEEKTSATVDFVHPFSDRDPAGPVRTVLIGQGFQEAITNSMQDERRARLAGKAPVKILNPQNSDMQYLRTSLLPGLLDAAARNQNFGTPDVRLFEVGHVFSRAAGGQQTLVEDFLEEERVALLLTGAAAPRHWSRDVRMTDVFDIKGEVEDLLRKLSLDKWRFISYSTGDGLTESTLSLEIQGTYAGYLGRIRDNVREIFGIEAPVFVAEVSLPSLFREGRKSYEALPRYPRARRDVAFIVDEGVPAATLETVIRDAAGELLHKIELFDVFAGKALGAGKRSMAFSLELMSLERALTGAEVESVLRRVIENVERECHATLRGVKE